MNSYESCKYSYIIFKKINHQLLSQHISNPLEVICPPIFQAIPKRDQILAVSQPDKRLPEAWHRIIFDRISPPPPGIFPPSDVNVFFSKLRRETTRIIYRMKNNMFWIKHQEIERETTMGPRIIVVLFVIWGILFNAWSVWNPSFQFVLKMTYQHKAVSLQPTMIGKNKKHTQVRTGSSPT